MAQLKQWGKENLLFVVAFSLAIISSIFGQFDITFINFNVIVTLFGLMLVLGLFEESGALKQATVILVERSRNTRRLVQALVLISFLASFLLSNDIAVLTLLPIYLMILGHLPNFKGQTLGAVLIVIAANLGGVFFPFSNPQNLTIYNEYQLGFFQLIKWTAPLMVAGLILVFIPTFFIEKRAADTMLNDQPLDKKLILYGTIGMIVMVLAVFGLLNVYGAVLATSIGVLLIGPKYFKHVDYLLLLTFASFFIFVGNIAQLPAVQSLLTTYINTPVATYLAGIGFSQLISNVPTTILLTPFTDYAHELLLGVNIGGLGTLQASLANLIAFNIIRPNEAMDTRHYLKRFLFVNFAILLVLAVLFFPF